MKRGKCVKSTLTAYLMTSFLWYAYIIGKNTVELPLSEAHEIGKKIWHNECSGSKDYLTWWGKGEEFASFGIGHFIWYPKNYDGPFSQTFPSLLSFFKEKNVPLPTWLIEAHACPWTNRTDFLKDLNSAKMAELRKLLVETMPLQTEFLVNRLSDSLPQLLAALPKKKQDHIKRQFRRVLRSKNGSYVLVDYLNFKGDGTNQKEQYNGQGWGLLHVLEKMSGRLIGKHAVQEFAQTAQQLLETRVQNAPPERNEEQWLAGWKNRVSTYRQ